MFKSLLLWIQDRIPHQGTRSIELDFARGIAILLVMGAHFFRTPTNNIVLQTFDRFLVRFGGEGVVLFFVLSGFLVGGLLLKELKLYGRIDARRFILRRGMKIWPGYYAYLLCIILTHAHPLKSFLWQNLFHVQNFFGTSLLHTWSLSIEEHFYLFLAFSLYVFSRNGWSIKQITLVLGSVLGLVFVLRLISCFEGNDFAATHFTENRMDALTCGVLLAIFYHFYPDIFMAIAKQKYLLLAGFLCAFLVLGQLPLGFWMNSIGLTLNYLMWAAFLILFFTHSTRIRGQLWYRLVSAIGVYSYGIYLYHNSVRHPVQSLVLRLPASMQWATLWGFQLIASVVVGALMTHLIEWPFLKLRNRMLPQKVADTLAHEYQQS